MGLVHITRYMTRRGRALAHLGRHESQRRVADVQARYRAEQLLREVGWLCYEHDRGQVAGDAVTHAVATLKQHLDAHPVDLATSGWRGYLRAAAARDAARSTAGSADADQIPFTTTVPRTTSSSPAESSPADETDQADR